MVQITHLAASNFDNALRGMRHPLESYNKSDSQWVAALPMDGGSYTLQELLSSSEFLIGPNDMDLAHRLMNAGPEHAKFLRQIFISMDITAPIYW